MESFNIFKKSTAPCSGSTGNRKAVAPKRTRFFSLFKKTLPLLILFIWTESSSQIQNFNYWWEYPHYILEWEPNVGCGTYTIRGEEMVSDGCIRACKGSEVEYFIKDYIMNSVWGNEENVTVDWEVTNGTIMAVYDETYPQYGAKIKWSDTEHYGFIKFTISSDNYQKEYSLCVRLIPPPKADFEILGEGMLCQDSPVFFNNLSVAYGYGGIKSTLWDFGDGNHSSQYNPQHTYQHPGNYEVTLTVTNHCNCEDTYSMVVHVSDKPAPIISCPGVVVADNIITYTTEDPCGGKWSADGGTIVSGGSGNFAEIAWNDIDPEYGFGHIHYHSNCGCATTIKVPVVVQEADIKGNILICEGEKEIFSLPQWPTTIFSWSIDNGNSNSLLILTDQPNEVFVDGATPGIYTLQCNYYNTIWGYSGTAEINVTVAKKAEITGDDIEFCYDPIIFHNYENESGDPVDWVLWHNGEEVEFDPPLSSSSIFSYNFPDGGGTYMLTATTGDGCISDPFLINVTEVPTPDGEIEGSQYVCEDLAYTYTYQNTVPNTLIVWEEGDGATIQGNDTGNTVNVVFTGPGPYTLTVKRRSLNEPVCWAEDELTLTIYNAAVATPDIDNNTSSENIFCPSSETTFTADFGGLVPDHIEWVVVSDSNDNTNFGSIIGGINGTEVTIKWHEISDSNTGKLILNATYCGQTYAFPTSVELYEMPSLTMTIPEFVCPGDLTFPVTVTINPEIESGELLFKFSNSNYSQTIDIENLILDTNGNYIININNGFTNLTSSNITRSLMVTLQNPNGCLYSPSVTESAEIFPEAKISITPGDNIMVCVDEPLDYSYQLTSNFAVGSAGTGGFEWFKENPLGADTPLGTGSSYTISHLTQFATPGGIYYVVAEDVNGCLVRSNDIKVFQYENCNGTPEDPEDSEGCEPYIGAEIDLVPVWNCDEITVELVADTPNQIIWAEEIGFLTLTSGQGTSLATYTTDVPGEHLVTVTLKYDGCTINRSITVTKYYEPNLYIGAECNDNNGYNVTLHNNSIVFGMNPANITFKYYDEYNNLLETNYGDSFTLPGVIAPGTYTYTLELSSSGKPTCTVEQTIILPSLDEPEFELVGPFCAKEVIELTIQNPNPLFKYSWHFEDAHIIASVPTTEINIATPGQNKEITLKAKLPFGCEVEYTITDITINEADSFAGSFSPDTITGCEGETFPAIEFEPDLGANEPSGYIWMQGSEPVPGATSATFTPAESGQYWAVLTDGNGCKNYDMAKNPVNVNIRLRPYVSITGNNSLCYEDTTVLAGTVTDSSLERRWLRGTSPTNGTPISEGALGNWSTTTPLKITIQNLSSNFTAGTYYYTLEVRPDDEPDCGNSFTFELTAHEELITPLLEYVVETCSPYEVEITVTNIQTEGEYYWSNGTSGASTIVNSGGIYQVTYIAPTGCEITADITVPEDPEKSMWIFPTGCFDLCDWDMDPQPYIIGPTGIYGNHKWFVDNVVVQGGSGAVEHLDILWEGAYQLVIGEGTCTYESGFAHITIDAEGCNPPPCEGLSYSIETIRRRGGVYEVYGHINNSYGIPVTVTFSSFNGYGTYTPGSVTIPFPGSYIFGPLVFTPNPGFTGGDDFLVISIGNIPCTTLIPVHFPTPPAGPDPANRLAAGDLEITDNSGAVLKVMPNPSEALAAVSYHLGTAYQKAESLRIYTILGTPVTEIDLKANSGDVPIDLSRFPAGTYIITLQADGQTILHQKLIKK